jgi:uncharacterized membrane protein
MNKQRLEAFSDGVIAILITIMVLELHPPEGADLHALQPLLPKLLSYLLSFTYLGIYWNNHHHMLHVTHHVNGRVLWANLHLLFWLSLVPFMTSWVGEHHLTPVPTALYGVVFIFAAIAYTILQNTIIAADGGPTSVLGRAVEHDWKGKVSILLYLTGIACSFVRPWIGQLCYVIVALVWFTPDRRIERRLPQNS